MSNQSSSATISKYFSGDKKSNKSEQPAKRSHSEVSNASADDMNLILAELEEIKQNIKETVTRNDLKESIQNIVKEMMTDMKTEMRAELSKIYTENQIFQGKLQDKIDGLEVENHSLRELISSKEKSIREMSSNLRETHRVARDAQERSNHNEQFSRKNNLKIHGIKESQREDTPKIACEVLKTLANIDIKEADIVATHRIPGKADRPRPIILKVRNPEIKLSIMRKRKIVKNSGKGVRLTDDVTKLNTELIQRLLDHREIGQAWYFNGNVFANPKDSTKRIKFNIHDNIDAKIRNTK